MLSALSAAHVAKFTGPGSISCLRRPSSISQRVTPHQMLSVLSLINQSETCSSSTLVVQGTAGGEALQIGAARDKQTAADTAAMSGGASTGAATFAFIQVLHHPPATMIAAASSAAKNLSISWWLHSRRLCVRAANSHNPVACQQQLDKILRQI